MKQLEPRGYEMGGTEAIWVRGDEDLQLYINFKETVIDDTSFTLLGSEYKWPYMPQAYTKLEDFEISTGFTEEFTSQGFYKVSVIIPQSQVTLWDDRRIDTRLVAERDGRKWVVCNTTITVARGD